MRKRGPRIVWKERGGFITVEGEGQKRHRSARDRFNGGKVGAKLCVLLLRCGGFEEGEIGWNEIIDTLIHVFRGSHDIDKGKYEATHHGANPNNTSLEVSFRIFPCFLYVIMLDRGKEGLRQFYVGQQPSGGMFWVKSL